jgi:hypothetical protein
MIATGIAGIFKSLHIGKLEAVILYLLAGVIMEDVIRTGFMIQARRSEINIVKAAILFSAIISFLEIIIQTYDLILTSARVSFGVMAYSDSIYDMFFSLSYLPMASVGIDLLRPFIHFLLCILFYTAWRTKAKFIYAMIIVFHLSFDLFVNLISERSHLYAVAPGFCATFLFAVVLSLTAFWLRVRMKRELRITASGDYGDYGDSALN